MSWFGFGGPQMSNENQKEVNNLKKQLIDNKGSIYPNTNTITKEQLDVINKNNLSIPNQIYTSGNDLGSNLIYMGKIYKKDKLPKNNNQTKISNDSKLLFFDNVPDTNKEKSMNKNLVFMRETGHFVLNLLDWAGFNYDCTLHLSTQQANNKTNNKTNNIKSQQKPFHNIGINKNNQINMVLYI